MKYGNKSYYKIPDLVTSTSEKLLMISIPAKHLPNETFTLKVLLNIGDGNEVKVGEVTVERNLYNNH